MREADIADSDADYALTEDLAMTTDDGYSPTIMPWLVPVVLIAAFVALVVVIVLFIE